ncbi:polyketide synthase [Streptomyces thinghirensis]|nr:polyketide synthase [Streptomyces thinghirensis]
MLGEGVGVVVLKPLAWAQADGDRVLAVLEGIAVNNDGRTAGPATPNLMAQKDVMAEALALSGRAPRDVGWVETNASGSTVTDLLELKAIEAVYGAGQDRATRLALGSVKPNIGHPLAAEGIAAFIKVALMLHHRQQVPFRSGQQPPALRHGTPPRCTSRESPARGLRARTGPRSTASPTAAPTRTCCSPRPRRTTAPPGRRCRSPRPSARSSSGAPPPRRPLIAPPGRRRPTCSGTRTDDRANGTPPVIETPTEPCPWSSCSPGRALSTTAWARELHESDEVFRTALRRYDAVFAGLLG